MRVLPLLPCLALSLALVGCSSSRYETVWLSPRIDLSKHGTIGVVEFASPEESELGLLATRRFTEAARQDQGLVPMLGLEPQPEPLDAGRLRAIGEAHEVQTLVVGRVTVSKVRPRVSIDSALESGSLAGAIEATLVVELVEASTGASLWSATSRAKRDIGGVGIHDGQLVLDTGDPRHAYGDLVDLLVADVTRDFRARSQRRRVE